ncbi:hypothetical protein [Arsenicicoccus dermatophilus]|uniref:hypothetical protein n=1 Tax=Arsenicicoccus dermatophilus TaxID=1076331 RepID=UPI001F4C7F25|nr:hypothetical protein [Arsenicicoccus dermatophilus]MCH8612936.1 hypothetical protein [Arsenicicoccus dermatophilus]
MTGVALSRRRSHEGRDGRGRSSAGTPPPARLVGVDLARGVALLGILVNHLVGGLPSQVLWDVHAVLFAVLVGVGAQLAIARGATIRDGGVRALVLAAVGLTLAQLDTRAAIVLVPLAVVSAAATWAARARTSAVAGVGGALALAGPVVAHLGRRPFAPRPWSPDVGWSELAEPGRALVTLLCATSYPALTWTALGLLGVLAGRAWLRPDAPADVRPILAAGMTLLLVGRVGGILAVLLAGRPGLLDAEAAAARHHTPLPDEPERLLLVGPYLPSTPSLLVSAGAALLVLAACLAIGRSAAWGGSWPVRSVAALGSMTLSAYTLHVLLLPGTETVLRARPELTGWPTYAGHVVVLAAVLGAWRAWLPHPPSAGPLEWATRVISRRSGPSPAPTPPRRRG